MQSTDYGMFQKLGAHWGKVNEPYLNQSLEEIPGRSSSVGKTVFAASRCMKLGLCVCGKNPSGCKADLFHSKLVSKMKVFFAKGSIARQRLETNLVVFKFHCLQADREEHSASLGPTLYFSLGYINMKLWLFSLMQMVVDDRSVRSPDLLPLRLPNLVERGGSGAPLADVALHVFATTFDLDLEIDCKVCYLVRSNEMLGTPQKPMLPHHMEINTSQQMDLFVWRGFELEKPKPKARPRKPKAPGPDPKPRPRRPRPRPQDSAPQPSMERSDQECNDETDAMSLNEVDMATQAMPEVPLEEAFRNGVVEGEYDWDALSSCSYQPSVVAPDCPEHVSDPSDGSGDDVQDSRLQEAAAFLDEAEAELGLEVADPSDRKDREQYLSSEEVANLDFSAWWDDGLPGDAFLSEKARQESGDSDSQSANPSDVSVSSLSTLAEKSFDGSESRSGESVCSELVLDCVPLAAGTPSPAKKRRPNLTLLEDEAEEVQLEGAVRERAAVLAPDDRLEHIHGSIRYNHRTKNLVSHCTVHGGLCRRTRTTEAGRRGSQGRPIGELAAWLEAAANYRSAREHSNDCAPSVAERQASRARIEPTAEGRSFSNRWERERRDGEGPEPGPDAP